MVTSRTWTDGPLCSAVFSPILGGTEVGGTRIPQAQKHISHLQPRERLTPAPPFSRKSQAPKGLLVLTFNNFIYHEKRILENSSTDCRYSADRTGYRPDNNELHGSLKKREASLPFFRFRFRKIFFLDSENTRKYQNLRKLFFSFFSELKIRKKHYSHLTLYSTQSYA